MKLKRCETNSGLRLYPRYEQNQKRSFSEDDQSFGRDSNRATPKSKKKFQITFIQIKVSKGNVKLPLRLI
jgi:hypothetical protein